jgi:hypothetical protein
LYFVLINSICFDGVMNICTDEKAYFGPILKLSLDIFVTLVLSCATNFR